MNRRAKGKNKIVEIRARNYIKHKDVIKCALFRSKWYSFLQLRVKAY